MHQTLPQVIANAITVCPRPRRHVNALNARTGDMLWKATISGNSLVTFALWD